MNKKREWDTSIWESESLFREDVWGQSRQHRNGFGQYLKKSQMVQEFNDISKAGIP